MKPRIVVISSNTKSALTPQSWFDDRHAISFEEGSSDSEERWQTLGMIGGVLVMVAHTSWEERGEEVIRLISARKATSRERKLYEAHQTSG